MAKIEDVIEDIIRNAVEDLRTAFLEMALETLKAGSGKTRKKEGVTNGGFLIPVRAKRTDEELKIQSLQILRAVGESTSGWTIEELGNRLEVNTAQLTLPMRRLLTDKTVTKKGKYRATRYYAK